MCLNSLLILIYKQAQDHISKERQAQFVIAISLIQSRWGCCQDVILLSFIYLHDTHIEQDKHLSFDECWITRFLELFGSKREVFLFCQSFTNTNKFNNTNGHHIKSQKRESIKEQKKEKSHSSENNNITDDDLNMMEADLQLEDMDNLFLEESDVEDAEENDIFNEPTNDYSAIAPQDDILQYAQKQNNTTRIKTAAGLSKLFNKEKKRLTQSIIRSIKEELLALKKAGKPYNLSQLAVKYNLHRNSLNRLKDKWKEDPELGSYLFKNRLQKKHIPHTSAVNEELAKEIKQKVQFVEAFIEQNPYLSTEKIIDLIRRVGNGKATNHKLLHRVISSIKYVKRRISTIPPDRNSQKNIEARAVYCEKYLQYVSQHAKIFFFDEAIFDLKLAPQFVWILQGQTPKMPTIDPNHNVALFIMVSDEGQPYWKTGLKTTNRSYTSLRTVQDLMKKVCQNNTGTQRKILVMQNNSEYVEAMKEFLRKKGWNLLLMPPDSPQLNPSYFFFEKVKQQIRKSSIQSVEELAQSLNQLSSSLLQSMSHTFFQKMSLCIFNGHGKIPIE